MGQHYCMVLVTKCLTLPTCIWHIGLLWAGFHMCHSSLFTFGDLSRATWTKLYMRRLFATHNCEHLTFSIKLTPLWPSVWSSFLSVTLMKLSSTQLRLWKKTICLSPGECHKNECLQATVKHFLADLDPYFSKRSWRRGLVLRMITLDCYPSQHNQEGFQFIQKIILLHANNPKLISTSIPVTDGMVHTKHW